jgi:hypothetical protein
MHSLVLFFSYLLCLTFVCLLLLPIILFVGIIEQAPAAVSGVLGKRKHATSPTPLPVKSARTAAPPTYGAPLQSAPYAAAPAPYAAAPAPYAAAQYGAYYGAPQAPVANGTVDPNAAYYAQQGYAPY